MGIVRTRKGNFDFERDIQIDQDRLDKEWVRQPALFSEYATAAVDARSDMDQAKERLELVRAKLDSEIRLAAVGDKKPTEAAIANAVLPNEEYQKASKEYLEAKNVWEMLKVAAEAMTQRKEALENLVKLYGMEYFSSPRESRDSSEGLKRKTTEAIKERMTRRSRD